jgi:hypothetical protein
VRALLTLPAYDHSGDINYFTVLGGISANAFTNNAAGRQARAIADSFTEYLFPQAGTDPIGFTFRQSSLLDMRHGYFGADPAWSLDSQVGKFHFDCIEHSRG